MAKDLITDKPGEQVFVDSKVGFHVYVWINQFEHRFNNLPHPKVGICEIMKTITGKMVPRYLKGGGNYHQLYLDIPEIPPFCAALMKCYDENIARFKEMTGQEPPPITKEARADIEKGREDSRAKEELSELEQFLKESGMGGFSKSSPPAQARRGTQSETERLIAEMEVKK